MSPVICLPDEETLRWFLGKTRIAVVYASGAVTQAIFPRHLRTEIGEAIPACDFGVASPRALDRIAVQLFEHGDCAVFARQTLVRRVASKDCLGRRHLLRDPLPGPEAVPPTPARADKLMEALKTAVTLLTVEPAPDPTVGPHLNPYDVLGVKPDASLIDIRRARRARMMEYHPDRVASLGTRLRQVAEAEARKINWAGSFLEKSRLS